MFCRSSRPLFFYLCIGRAFPEVIYERIPRPAFTPVCSVVAKPPFSSNVSTPLSHTWGVKEPLFGHPPKEQRADPFRSRRSLDRLRLHQTSLSSRTFPLPVLPVCSAGVLQRPRSGPGFNTTAVCEERGFPEVQHQPYALREVTSEHP